MLMKAVLSGSSRLQLQRLLYTSSVLCKVDRESMQRLSKLRKKTHFAFVKCKEALEKHDQDVDKAAAWLREQAQKEGWEKASKLGTRPMSQGLIGLLTDANHAVLVEVNCETDFVAKNDQFQKLVQTLCRQCLEHGKEAAQNKVLWDRATANSLSASGESRSLYDLVAMEIGKMGENMALSRAAFVRSEEDQLIGKYVHHAGPALSGDSSGNCMMGKYGALVLFRQSNPAKEHDKESLKFIGWQLAQHVVGMSPTSVGVYEPITSESADGDVTDERKKKKKRKQKKTDASEVNIVEDTRMVYQDFLSQGDSQADIIVGEYLLTKGLEVNDFVRFECGEVLEEVATPAEKNSDEKPAEERSTSV